MRLSFDCPSRPAKPVVIDDPLLVVAGFTGRDRGAVDEHIAELGLLGIAAPDRAPALFALPNWIVQVEPEVAQVAAATTSGEVEPVLVRLSDGDLFVTLGSDHTDRALERISFGASKLTCPKIVCRTVWNVDEIGSEWDQLRLESFTGEELTPYQWAEAADLLSPRELLAVVDEQVPGRRPLLLFMGTVPLLDAETRFADRFTARLSSGSDLLQLAYDVEVIDPLDGSLSSLTDYPPRTVGDVMAPLEPQET